MKTRLEVREAGHADAGAIAALHAASWRATYRGIMPDSFLDGPVESERLRHWQQALAQPEDGDLVLLAHRGGAPVAFVAVRREPDGLYDAYLDNLHVRPGLTGGGIGRRLLGLAARRLAQAGRRSLCLWAYDANAGGIAFYERLGAVVVERGTERFAGADLPHSRLAWTDTAALADACGVPG